MPIRYYPASKIKTNLTTDGTEYLVGDSPYTGKYYLTFDGKAFQGPDPITGPGNPLVPVTYNQNTPGLYGQALTVKDINKLASLAKKNPVRPSTQPVPYYPKPTTEDYSKGYITRYFTKRINDKGFVVEISRDEYNSIKNGTASYDVSMYLTGEMMWKLTGPLNQKRVSQYDIRAGIVDTNQRLTEELNKTLLGVKDFISGNYSQFATPTE